MLGAARCLRSHDVRDASMPEIDEMLRHFRTRRAMIDANDRRITVIQLLEHGDHRRNRTLAVRISRRQRAREQDDSIRAPTHHLVEVSFFALWLAIAVAEQD